jgi:hypothetical protein
MLFRVEPNAERLIEEGENDQTLIACSRSVAAGVPSVSLSRYTVASRAAESRNDAHFDCRQRGCSSGGGAIGAARNHSDIHVARFASGIVCDVDQP